MSRYENVQVTGTSGCGCASIIIAIMIAWNFDRILSILEKAIG